MLIAITMIQIRYSPLCLTYRHKNNNLHEGEMESGEGCGQSIPPLIYGNYFACISARFFNQAFSNSSFFKFLFFVSEINSFHTFFTSFIRKRRISFQA